MRKMMKDGADVHHGSGLINPLRKGLASRSPAQMQDETHLARKSFLQCNAIQKYTNTQTIKNTQIHKYTKIQIYKYTKHPNHSFLQCKVVHNDTQHANTQIQ